MLKSPGLERNKALAAHAVFFKNFQRGLAVMKESRERNLERLGLAQRKEHTRHKPFKHIQGALAVDKESIDKPKHTYPPSYILLLTDTPS